VPAHALASYGRNNAQGDRYEYDNRIGTAIVSIRQVPGFISGCWNGLQERQKRAKSLAALYGLNGRDLQDIGIAYGDIEYVVSNSDIDPRGV
jgi:uncharacterized protein YjiS (DUF1127 family)